MEVINLWKLSSDKSYLLIKVREVRIVIEVKRSDDWCGDVSPVEYDSLIVNLFVTEKCILIFLYIAT